MDVVNECHICDNRRMKNSANQSDLSIFDNIEEILTTMDLSFNQKIFSK